MLRLVISFERGGPLDRIEHTLHKILGVLSEMKMVDDFSDEDKQVKDATKSIEEAKDRIPHGTETTNQEG